MSVPECTGICNSVVSVVHGDVDVYEMEEEDEETPPGEPPIVTDRLGVGPGSGSK